MAQCEWHNSKIISQFWVLKRSQTFCCSLLLCFVDSIFYAVCIQKKSPYPPMHCEACGDIQVIECRRWAIEDSDKHWNALDLKALRASNIQDFQDENSINCHLHKLQFAEAIYFNCLGFRDPSLGKPHKVKCWRSWHRLAEPSTIFTWKR